MEPTGYQALDELLPRLAAVPSLVGDAVEAERIAVLGRKQGLVTALMKRLPELPPEDRKAYGAAVNQVKQAFEAALDARSAAVAASGGDQPPGLDLTMPGRRRWVGSEHPVETLSDSDLQNLGVFVQ